jgi:hypothetical protein
MTRDHPEMRVYRSIFLSAGWAHQRYFGWNVVSDSPGIRLLQRKRGPLTKNLILLTVAGRDELPQVLKTANAAAVLSEVMVHDFDCVLGDEPTLAGLKFRRATATERLLNVATIVVDLTVDEADLFGGMDSSYRRKIRQAEADGISIEAHDHPSEELLQRFTSALDALASERGFDGPHTDATRRMFRSGDSLLLVARKQDAELNYLHLYTADNLAYFMSGVNLSRANDGAGKLIHWKAMQHLKARGYEWYDLGGVTSETPDDGIYNFKRRFGGRFVSLGTEWRYTSTITRNTLGAAERMRRIQRKWSRRAAGARVGLR